MRTKVRHASPPSEEGLIAKVRRLPAVHPGEVLSEDLMTPYFWMNLQAAYDLDVATRASADRIKRDVHPRDVA